MPEKNFSFANLVATPTKNSWSQAYNAGKLFAVLSLSKSTEEINEDLQDVTLQEEFTKESVGSIGKEVLNHLEQEYFTLEEKNLDSIKSAILVTTQKIPDDMQVSYVVISILNDILYAVIIGNGKIILKRDDEAGVILKSEDNSKKSLKTASGFLKDNDLIIIQTESFAQIVPLDELAEYLDEKSPEAIAEDIAPKIHAQANGAASGIIIKFTHVEEPKTAVFEEDKPVEEESIDSNTYIKTADEEIGRESEEGTYQPHRKKSNYIQVLQTTIRQILPEKLRLSHSKKLVLTIAVVLFIVIILSIYSAYQKQQDDKLNSVINKYYPVAEKKFIEGQGLVDLNQNLARDYFLEAQKNLQAAKEQLPENSAQYQKVNILLEKVNDLISNTSGITQTEASEVSDSNSKLLSFIKEKKISIITKDNKNFYFLEKNKFYSTDYDGKGKKEIIKDGWKKPVALATYFGNLYLLDQEIGIIKFASIASGYAKNKYFADGVNPDLSTAVSMAIDNSIYVLFENGTILKFIRGKAETFTANGLDKPFLSPVKIYTDTESENLYVLDPKNSRIVVLEKNGTYKIQYQTGILQSATDFEVLEKDKKCFVLSGNKIYQINFK